MFLGIIGCETEMREGREKANKGVLSHQLPLQGTGTLGSVEETSTLSQSNTKTVEFVTKPLKLPYATHSSVLAIFPLLGPHVLPRQGRNVLMVQMATLRGMGWAPTTSFTHTLAPSWVFQRIKWVPTYECFECLAQSELPLGAGAIPTVLSRALWIRARWAIGLGSSSGSTSYHLRGQLCSLKQRLA